MSREEYLQKMDEGFFKDKFAPAIKRGWEAVKSAFRIGMAKVKNFIAIFDGSGKVLPVVSPQAVIDKFSNDSAIRVYAPKSISDAAVAAGGKGCDFKATLKNDDEIYDDESFDDPEGYKNSIEYQNFLSIPSIIQEAYDISEDEANKLFEDMVGESWEGIKASRIKYSKGEDFAGVKIVDYKKFESIINQMIEKRVKFGNKKVIDSKGVEWSADRNALFFGAPGIGKSSIPNAVIKKYNENVAENDPSRMISLIDINCALLEEGSLVMPTMPQEVNIDKVFRDFKDTFPQAEEYLKGLDDVKNIDAKKMSTTLSGLVLKVKDAPKSWLPSYQRTGDDRINTLLDAYANGGVYVDENNDTSTQTGCGGIILFDEFLRANPAVFSQLMTFFLTRKLYDWHLGSKWSIIACSNRPCDDEQVAKVWKSWKGSPAATDRNQRIFMLNPDPEQWKAWIKTKKVDGLFLDFIFDPTSKTGDDEYPRWHSMVKNAAGDSKMDLPIGPRRWEDVIKWFNQYEAENGYEDMYDMPDKEIREELGGFFDDVFIEEFMEWLENHKLKVDLDGIMSDPESVEMPMGIIKDPDKIETLVKNILEDFKLKFKDDPGKLSEKQFVNLCIWLGIHYKDYLATVNGFLESLLGDIFKPGTEYSIDHYPMVMLVCSAAFPEHDLLETIEAQTKKSVNPWPEDSLDIIKNYIKKYFPWRMKGDKFNFVDELSIDDDE